MQITTSEIDKCPITISPEEREHILKRSKDINAEIYTKQQQIKYLLGEDTFEKSPNKEVVDEINWDIQILEEAKNILLQNNGLTEQDVTGYTVHEIGKILDAKNSG